MTRFRISSSASVLRSTFVASALVLATFSAQAQELIPHAQDAPPGPALSPAEAIAKMKVPKGFVVETFAAEPMVVNPVAMTFDDAGRVWITESLEYPRREPGPGRDRIKVLEDTDGDGKADKATIFAEGLNIPSGIAVGHGGVWVANAPDILFLKDTDGDGKADKQEVIVTGFGRDDTHELPNSLTWGPDGWLYGWNGVFNRSVINYRGKTHDFTCAIFRIHPVTRDFELFCEGTSNPWGIAVNAEGELFASACVIDHLWHLTETGYYHRQGGPYPPFTWKIESIVDHKHQKAAYCGIHFFDGANFPAEFRRKLVMGNIHGNAINLDSVGRNGSTYTAMAHDDFLQANDAWFMPVVQKTGPDGALYLVDWYDRYHCYQDANRDPAGIDRLKGRIYRVRYAANPLLPKDDLSRKTGAELVELLGHDNGWHRETARRILVERKLDGQKDALVKLVTDASTPRDKRLGALYALASTREIPEAQSRLWIDDAEPTVRAWVVRYYGSLKGDATPRMAARVAQQASDANADVALQAAIALGKFAKQDPLPGWSVILQEHGGDKIIPRIVFRNIEPRLAASADDLPEVLADLDLKTNPGAREIFPRIYERLLFAHPVNAKALPWLLTRILESDDAAASAYALRATTQRLATLKPEDRGGILAAIRPALAPVLEKLPVHHGTHRESVLILAQAGDADSLNTLKSWFEDKKVGDDHRIRAWEVVLLQSDGTTAMALAKALIPVSAGKLEHPARGEFIARLGIRSEPEVAELMLAEYDRLEPNNKGRAVQLLTERPRWAEAYVARVEAGKLPPTSANLNQVRRLQGYGDKAFKDRVAKIWGRIRSDRNPQRDLVVSQMRNFLARTPGDPYLGKAVFEKQCAQCHKIYGVGQEIGPELTSNGRNDYEQLLSNVFDPNLVIGENYQAVILSTKDGRTLTGLLTENSPEEVRLKIQGGTEEVFPRDQVEEIQRSTVSLMPENLETLVTPQELADLFAFLALDQPPGDPKARLLPGAPEPKRRSEAGGGE
ncbi:c-type cytochrome [bacterium]|nr:c-type cytochrome [bacterium]